MGDDCFIGSNSNIIAPVKVQDNSYIACGTTLNQDVPRGSLVIGRSRAIIKEGRAALLLGKYTAEKLAKQSNPSERKKRED